MPKNPNRIEHMIDELEQVRDEIKVKIHLASAEVRDEWNELEHKWEHLRGRAKRVGDVVEEAAEDVGDALGLVADEVKRGYERIRKFL